jgi:N-acyl-D-amino-acid deacylase
MRESKAVLDVILSGGLVVDGTGTPGFRTDIGIDSTRVVRIGDCTQLSARSKVDCSGLVVAPGFVDAHGHSDEKLFVCPLAESKIRQGITTEIGGNCGMSPGPLSQRAADERRERSRAQHGIEAGWTRLDDFFTALEHAPPAMNFACLVGLGETRSAAGFDLPTPLDRDGLARECALVAAACEEGALGVSSGLIYPPGSFADIDELAALAAAARDAGSPLYVTHLRSEGDELVEAVDEALAIGRRADVAVQLSHHKASGRKNWGKVHDSLARVERARRDGLDVVIDQYPYKASSTGLDAILPADVNVGGSAVVCERLADPAYAALVAARVELRYAGRWNEVLVATVASEANKTLEGQSIAAIAHRSGKAPVRAALDLLVEERLDVSAIYFTMCEDDVRTVLSFGWTCIGSDSSAWAVSGPGSNGKPHPRTFGTFPRVFKRYVRETGLLDLAEAVRRSTSLPAARFGLRDRGTIAAGNFADVVVFDAAAIADTSTYESPHCYPEGIAHVLVNGVMVVAEGVTTGRRPGRVLRRGRDT